MKLHPSRPIRRQRGLTLIELLVVLVILTLVAGVIGPRVLDQLGGAKTKTAKVQIAEIEQALDLFKLDVGRYPSDGEGLNALVNAPGGAGGWNGPYLKKGVPTDPWGNGYHYKFAGSDPEIVSYGADGSPGGSGENADVSNLD